MVHARPAILTRCRALLAPLLLACAVACAPGDNEVGEQPPIAPAGSIITPTDLGALSLGGAVEGPAGPALDTSLIAGAVAVGNLSSRVHCPGGIDPCRPSEARPGTIYTYVHEVRPGLDGPNDAGFAMPDQVVPVDRGESFALGFPAAGFTGVAGYAVEQAGAVLAEGFNVVISCERGRLVWSLPADARWSTGETITFFWQSTRSPAEAAGDYIFIGDGAEARARGPMPAPGDTDLPAACD